MENYQRLKPVPNAIATHPFHNLGFNCFAFCSSWQDATYYRIIERLEYLTQINRSRAGICCYILAGFPNTMGSSAFLPFRDELKLAPDKFSMV